MQSKEAALGYDAVLVVDNIMVMVKVVAGEEANEKSQEKDKRAHPGPGPAGNGLSGYPSLGAGLYEHPGPQASLVSGPDFKPCCCPFGMAAAGAGC